MPFRISWQQPQPPIVPVVLTGYCIVQCLRPFSSKYMGKLANQISAQLDFNSNMHDVSQIMSKTGDLASCLKFGTSSLPIRPLSGEPRVSKPWPAVN